MATIMELINFYDHSSSEYEELLQNLMCSNGDIPFNIEEVDEVQRIIISTINNYLNRAHTRYTGLVILDKTLSQCSKDILSKYCILWMSKATQVLESIHSVSQELNISCKILGQLIIQTKGIPDIQKQVSTQNVKQLINAIGNLNSEKHCGSIYYLIAVLLHQYPEICERFQAVLKNLILLQIDSTQENLVNSSARCYALLAKATERSFKPPVSKPTYTGWLYHQALICNSLHAIMDILFSSLIELENVNTWDKLDLPNISEEKIIQFYFKQKQRFLNLCSYLSYMLRGFNKRNSVSPNEILKVLCRGLAIQPSNLKKQNSIREQKLYLILPQLHIALFNVLDALINGFKEQLIPFGSTILQLFLQSLQWTDTVLENHITLSGKKPFKNVRTSIYKCLNSWLVNTNSLSGIETVADEYLPSILKDIVPEKDRVLLTIQKTHNLSKRALKRLRDSQYEKGTYLTNELTSNKEYYLDTDVCKGSLIVLQNIFFNGGTCLKRTFFYTVQNIIIPLLYDCYLSSVEQKFYKENSDCRFELLRLLRALQMNPHCSVPLPTQYSVEIFEMALRDINLCIMQEAKIALAELDKIIHPHAPSIQLTQVETIQKEFITENQNVEHRETEDTFSVNIEHVEVENTELASSVKNKANSHTEENILDEDMAPSSNKRLKIKDIHLDNSIESTPKISNVNINENIKDVLQLEQANEVLPDKSNDTPKKQVNFTEQKNKIVNEESIPISNKSLDKAETELILKDTSKSIDSQIKSTSPIPSDTTEDSQLKKIDTSKNDDQDKKKDTDMICEDYSSIENEKEEEILLLFQDVPKDD